MRGSLGRPSTPWIAVAALLVPACVDPPPDPDATLATRVERGLACVARAYDGNSFDDDYLKYEYAREAIDSPLDGYRLTYRILDAYFIVLMLRQAGIGPGEARALFDRAEAVTAALVPAWRAKGIYNLRRNPAPDGIALDTYAILAVLRGDAAMGGVVESGLDGDGWLALDFYRPREAFRRLADESWAARALLVSHPARGLEVLDGICRQVVTAIESERDPLARANLVIHALEASSDPRLPPAGQRGEAGTALTGTTLTGTTLTGAGVADTGLADSPRRLEGEGLRLLEERAVRADTLTLANLAGALESASSVPKEALDSTVRLLAQRQEEDGCWSVSGDPADRSGRVFATLRVVLALGKHRPPGDHDGDGDGKP